MNTTKQGETVSTTKLEEGLKKLGFHLQDGTWINSNRALGYDNDCSDDERDDSFYEEKSSRFRAWAKPIADRAEALAKELGVTVKVTWSSEYGDIYLDIA